MKYIVITQFQWTYVVLDFSSKCSFSKLTEPPIISRIFNDRCWSWSQQPAGALRIINNSDLPADKSSRLPVANRADEKQMMSVPSLLGYRDDWV